jgi:acetyl esterase/lipase
LPVYVYFHGGGFIWGTIQSEDATCSRIVAAMPIIVVNVWYRHTPQHLYPTAHHDALDAFAWIAKKLKSFGGDEQKLIVGGSSVGANLAATVTRTNLARSGNARVSVKGLVLTIPVSLPCDISPYDTNGCRIYEADRWESMLMAGYCSG